jgi:hypothetical protein
LLKHKLGFVILAILTLLLDFSCDITGDCNNYNYKQINNEDNTFKILKFDRGCGATTANSIQLSLINFSDSLFNEPGNLFISNSKVGGYMENDTSVQPYWKDRTTIVIKYDKDLDVFKKDTLVYNIKVVYQAK